MFSFFCSSEGSVGSRGSEDPGRFSRIPKSKRSGILFVPCFLFLNVSEFLKSSNFPLVLRTFGGSGCQGNIGNSEGSGLSVGPMLQESSS